MNRLLRRFALLVVASLAAVTVACSGVDEPFPELEVTPTPVPAKAEVAAAPATAAAEPTAASAPTGPYDSNENMYRLFAGYGTQPAQSQEAIKLAVANNDKSMVPVMIEMLRFFGNWTLVEDTKEALSELTGEYFEAYARGWFEWMEWLGRNGDDYPPPDGYVAWKVDLMNLIDYRFGDFLSPAEQGSRINVAEIAWGGVRPDGIPPLEQAPVVAADNQDYLLPTDRVFGVSINGKHRAYPLRIVNAHEMANDLLGGEPISLAY